MGQQVNFRATDADVELMCRLRRPGESTADLIRRALHATQTLEGLLAARMESDALAVDEQDLAEVRAVQEEMADLRAW